MAHLHTLKLVPADLDRLDAVLRRAGVATREASYGHAFELLADIEHLAQLARVRAAGAPSVGGEDDLSRR